MKICIISPYPPQKGGIASYVEELVKRVSKKRKVILITYEKLGRKSRKNVEIKEVALPKFQWIRGLVFILKTLSILRKLPKDVKIIHAHYLHPCGTVAVLFKNLFRKDCKVIITLHGSDVTKLYTNRIFRIFLRRIMNHADAITCVSKFLKQKIENDLKRNIIVTYPGLPKIKIESKSSDIRKKLGVNKDEILVSYFAVLEEHKGIEVFLNLVEKFSNYQNVKFLIAGEGSKRKKVEKLAKKLKNLIYIGVLSREEVLNYMNASDVIVVPSKREALGLTALEASYLKKPVIAMDVGGLREVLSNSALAKDEKELKALLLKVITSKYFRKKLISENKKLLKKFSWKKTVMTFEKIYSTV